MKTAFAFDLDGTVTKQELLPLIAKKIRLEEEIAILTNLTMKSVIPFELSFKLRFGLLRNIKLEVIQLITSSVSLDPFISSFIKSNSDQCYIVTGNVDCWVAPLIEKLGCRFYSSTAIEENGYCKQLKSINNKALAIEKIRKKHDRVVAIGDGANDIPMFESSDISISYGGVHSPYKGLYSYSNYAVFDGKKICDLLNTLL